MVLKLIKERIAYPLTEMFREFVSGQSALGFILIVCAVISMAIANSPWQEGMFNILNFPLHLGLSGFHLKLSVLGWINDGLMSVFFFLIGLEIKRELTKGELSSFDRAILPAIAALGGMLIPALTFFSVNAGKPALAGWGIPMATDIAFSLGLLSLLGKRVPLSLKVLLTAIAVIDDLGAILVIAVFYTADLHLSWIWISLGLVIMLFGFNYFKVRYMAPYILVGLLLWFAVHESGIHATIAGVLLALSIPCNLPGRKHSPVERLEHLLHKPVNFFIMPLFALANTAIILEGGIDELRESTLGIGIILGLLFGKPAGILLFSLFTVRSGLASLPEGITWRDITGMGFMAGIGFTMSIFISFLAFSDPLFVNQSKMAIVTASVLAAATGLFILGYRRKAPG